jgi:hypothetical protein
MEKYLPIIYVREYAGSQGPVERRITGLLREVTQ